MRKFVFKIAFMILLTVFSIGLLALLDSLLVGSQYSYSYNASLIDKLERLQKTKSPKIILVGNSNLAFGINSEVIEEELGMSVVNLGYLGSLDNAFMEEIAKQNIGEGDIVVLSHTTYADDDRLGSIPMAWVTIDCHKEIAKILRKKDWIQILPGYPNYLRNAFLLKISGRGNRDTGDSYSRTAFNQYGDIVRRVDSSQMNPDEYFLENREVLPKINDVCIERINRLNRYVNDRGAEMVVAAFPIAYGKYTMFSEDDIMDFQRSLAERLECDIISDYRQYLYPYDFFYDQMYHLTQEAALVRTNQLIEDIRRWKETEDCSGEEQENAYGS